jgi:hypothetical protein
MTDAITAAAHGVAEGRQQAKRAHEAFAEAQAVVDHLNGRVATLQTERGALVAAGRVADTNGKLALRLAVVDADLADLAPLVAEANASAAKAQGAAAQADQAVARAEQHLAIATDEKLQERLAEHAGKLDELLLQTLTELRAVWTRRGARPTWFPSTGLADEVYRLHLMANQVRR